MRKGLIVLGVLAVIAIGIYSWGTGIYNNSVTLGQGVKESWGNVQTAYQRRNDMIVNLVKTVQGAAEYEKGTLEAVIKARSEATKTVIDPSNITPEQLAKFSEAQSSMSRLLVTVEQYPSLKANEGFLNLQNELVSTENQILTARTRYNEAIKPFNNNILTFPRNIVAGMFGLKEKPYFEAVAGADKNPDIKFDFNNKEAK
jgi:LemA protein